MMSRRRTLAGLAAAAVSAASLGIAAGPTDADDATGVSGSVESVLSLSLKRTAPDRVDATVTATVGPTRLTVSRAGRQTRVLGSFAAATAIERRSARTAVSSSGVTEQTITLGPAGP